MCIIIPTQHDKFEFVFRMYATLYVAEFATEGLIIFFYLFLYIFLIYICVCAYDGDFK